jgi:hypothetical protein
VLEEKEFGLRSGRGNTFECKFRGPAERTCLLPDKNPIDYNVRKLRVRSHKLMLRACTEMLLISRHVQPSVLSFLLTILLFCPSPNSDLQHYNFFEVRAPQQMLRTHRSLEAYCATLWWRWRERWSVFSFFQVMEHRWNENGRGKPKYSGPLCPPHIPHRIIRDRNRASAVGGRRLTAWAVAWPTALCYVPSSIWLAGSHLW